MLNRFWFRDPRVGRLLLERIIGEAWGLRLWSPSGRRLFGWAFITSLQARRAWDAYRTDYPTSGGSAHWACAASTVIGRRSPSAQAPAPQFHGYFYVDELNQSWRRPKANTLC